MAAARDLMTARDVMAMLGCSRTYITDHCAELGGRKLGRLLRFKRADIEAFVDAGRVQPAAPAKAQPAPIRRPVLDLVKLHGPINPVTKRPWGVAR
jgi:predicted DNA-binding transcriptional regulator AlpA